MRNRSSVRLHGRAPLWIALAIALLALPALFSHARGAGQAAREMENREAAPLPRLGLLRENARAYIDACDAHLKDSAGFRLQANALYRKLRFNVLRDPPLDNITIGGDGHIFLNGPQPTNPYAYFRSLCVRQGDPSPELLGQLDETMTAATRFFRRRGADVTFAIAPSTLSLYADTLPRKVPSGLRDACRAYPSKDHALAQLQRRGAADGRFRVFYPHALFAAHKDEPAFYPKERYHWLGRSVYLFTRHLVRDIGAVDALLLDDPASLEAAKDDILGFFGFKRRFEAFSYPYVGQPLTLQPADWLRPYTKRRQLLEFTTQNALSDKSVLLIANSFGMDLLPHLARCFAQTAYLDLNYLGADERKTVFRVIGKRLRPDHVLFVFDDHNVTNIPRILADFITLDQKEARQEAARQPPAPNQAP